MTVISDSKSKNGNKNIAKNFKLKEFACQDGSDTILYDTVTVGYLQKIRDHFGKPVNITSAYRTPTHNKAVGGAAGSLHVQGKAVDFYITGVEPAEIAAYAESIGCLGVGLYTKKRFVHIDSRTKKYFWVDDGREKQVATHGGKTNRSVVQEKAGLADGTMEYLDRYQYAADLYEKLANAMGV